MTSIVMGLSFIGLGIWGLMVWFDEFLVFLKGWGPVTLAVAGIIALIMGIASFRPSRNEKK